LQLNQPLPRAKGARLKLQLDFYSYIYQSEPIDLTTRKCRDSSYCVRLYNLELCGCFGVRIGRFAVILGSDKDMLANATVNYLVQDACYALQGSAVPSNIRAVRRAP
jgi:hypothetical protein